MKLTNAQVESLVREYRGKNDVENLNEAQLSKLKKDPKIIAEAKKYELQWKKMPEKIRAIVFGSRSRERDFIDAVAKQHFKPLKNKNRIENFNDVRDRIIIASIECDNLDQLRKKARL
jgi:hypothetical protein